jgi:superfamily II DNA or RNA helicase
MEQQIIKPNFAQKQALLNLVRTKKEGNNKALIVLPSGIGKTYLSAFDTLNVKGKILYIVHRQEILEQAIQSFKEIHKINDSEIGLFNRDNKDLDKKYIFSTIQTLSKIKNLSNINPTLFEYIILDEYHHSSANTYMRILSYFKPKFLLGMTATPYRLDN